MKRSPHAAPLPGEIETVGGDTPLGRWTFHTWRPKHLAGLVDHLWAFEGPTTDLRKRIFPNGCVELLLNFGDPYRLVEGAGAELFRLGWLGGPHTGPVVVEQPRYQNVMAVRLRPAGAYAVLALPMHEVTNVSVDLVDVVGPIAHELAERAAGAASVRERFAIVAGWIHARVARAAGMAPGIAWTVAQLDASAGAAPIASLRGRTGLSKAGIVSAFREQVGPSPKLYARIVRFHRALQALQSGPPRSLTDLALDASFYDQPHMNGEFRALGGVTPTQFMATRHPVGDGSTASDGGRTY
jgi:AraC-like DNA-binding protein